MNNYIVIGAVTALLAGCAGKPAGMVDEAELTAGGVTDTRHEPFDYWSVAKFVAPRFPDAAARDGVIGCVAMDLRINTEGKVSGVYVTRSYPHGVFVDSAIAAVKKFQWAPSEANPGREPGVQSLSLDFNMVSSASTKNAAEYQRECAER
ncbi:TonB family protein [Pseudidiomarina sediminum]|nr:TonB family protein [Pseudidiomarina sediminum]